MPSRGNHSSISITRRLVLPVLVPHVIVITYYVVYSLRSNFFCSTSYLWKLSMLLSVVTICFFSLLCNVSFYDLTIYLLSYKWTFWLFPLLFLFPCCSLCQNGSSLQLHSTPWYLTNKICVLQQASTKTPGKTHCLWEPFWPFGEMSLSPLWHHFSPVWNYLGASLSRDHDFLKDRDHVLIISIISAPSTMAWR